MSKIKRVLVLGLPRAGKTTFYRKLVKKHALDQASVSTKTDPVINYVEHFIEFNNNYYSLVDTPAFIFHPQNEIGRARQNQVEELIKKSDLIFWVIDSSQPVGQEVERLNKYLRRFFVPKILILSKLDLVEQKEYQTSLFQRLGQYQLYSFSASKP